MVKPRPSSARDAQKRAGQDDGTRVTAPVNRATDSANFTSMSPIFIHSSFRTGSTWLWSKFRRQPQFYAYYEIFNETLAKLDLNTISHSGRDWQSHHPVEAPYFLEFAPLLKDAGGVCGYDSTMAFADFFPMKTSSKAGHCHPQRDYVGLLISTAQQLGRTPVLTCTRSLARVGWLKQMFGGLHLSLQRDLLHQWFSYSNQALNGNPYFLGTVIETIFSETDDPVITILRRFIRDNRMPASADASLLPNDNLFICFAVLHIYLDYLGARDADVVVDLADLALDSAVRTSLTAALRDRTGADLQFSDAREVISAPMMLFADPDRISLMVKSIFLMLKQTARNDSDNFTHLTNLADQRMEKLWASYEHYCHFSSSAHVEISRLQATIGPDSHEADLVASQERETAAASLRDATIYAEGLLASRDQISAERDGLRTELATAASRADELKAACTRLEGEREDAILRISEVEAAMQREYDGLKAAFEDVSAAAAALRITCEVVTADRDATRTGLAAEISRSGGFDAARKQLEGERDDAILRISEVEAAMQRECGALKAAADDASAHAADLRITCEEVTADRDAARAALATEVSRREGLDAAVKLLEGERDAAILHASEVEAVMQRDCDALKAALVDASARAANFGASCDEATTDRDAARAELTAETSRSEGLDAARKLAESERDAALLRISEVEAAMQRDCDALKAALEDASAYAATMSTICDEITADRDAARTELAAETSRSDGLDAMQRQLLGERDAARLRASEVEAAMQRDCDALKAALEDSRADAEAGLAARDAAQRQVTALTSDAAAWENKHDNLTKTLADALRETERLRRDLGAHAALGEQQTAALATAQQRIAAYDQLLDARVFDDPGEADIFASRWTKMIATLK